MKNILILMILLTSSIIVWGQSLCPPNGITTNPDAPTNDQNSSAKEIQADGLELGKITTIQQEKIEELFLHLIEMEKRMKKLEEENQALKTQIIKNFK
jgi:hypothetical protein